MFQKFLFIILLNLSLFAFSIEKLDTFQADFVQSIVNQSGKKIQYSGKVFIKKPLKILWRYNDPISKDVFLINNHVTIIEPDLEQAIFSTLKNEINILQILQHGKRVGENQFESIIYNKPYQFFIEDDKLTTIKYKDDVDNQVMITFSNIVQNKMIKDSIYKFSIPDEYDIIRK